MTQQPKYQDIRDMPATERSELRNGERVQIYLGSRLVFSDAPKEALAIVSQYARAYFDQYPTVEEICLSEILCSRDAIIHIMDYISHICYTQEPYTLPGVSNPLDTIMIYRSARALGMDRYLVGMYHGLRERVESKDHWVLYHDLAAILRGPTVDPLYRDCVRVLGTYRQNGTIPDPECFERFAENFPEFLNAMNELGCNAQNCHSHRHSLSKDPGRNTPAPCKASGSADTLKHARDRNAKGKKEHAVKKEVLQVWNSANGVKAVSAEKFELIKKAMKRG
ncbi:hypothetical protein BCR34DRAFT_606589 [Clohesyomyces aquaticus]|uniref:Uncharacterized protein n=1 Tax=Clohesyomyces aquaticus TaxID=1231657 RepID=A0A1Y1YN68_9PLEO|nr:hypothetical protein BCR34DRAFT_606589 [Clohesyomyces aquaticus]